MVRIIKIVAKAGAVPAVALLLTGVVYELLGERRDREFPPRIGQPYDVGGGRTMNLACMGDGSPTVILEIGAGGPGMEWNDVQPALAKTTRTCWYDRAGVGWSDPSNARLSGTNVATDLHALLAAARVPPPYVLVGQSIGGLYIRVFTGKYPSEVAGLVFVDSSHEDQMLYEPKSHAGPAARMKPWQLKTIVLLSPLLYHAGVLRFLVNHVGPRIPANASIQDATVMALQRRPSVIYSDIRGGPVLDVLPEEVRQAGNLGSRPVIVLTAGDYGHHQDPQDEKEEQAFQEVWQHELHPSIAALSTRGRQIIVSGASHRFTSVAGRAAVVSAVSEVISAARSTTVAAK